MPNAAPPTPPEPRPFSPTDPPRNWLRDDERPPVWPEEFTVGSLKLHYEAGTLYRFYDASRQLLYIGEAAGDPTIRWTAHRYASPWWHLAAFVSVTHVTPLSASRRALEREAIRAELPLHNKKHLKPRARLTVRFDKGPEAVVEQFREVLLRHEFNALVAAFKAEPDGPSRPTHHSR